MEETLLYFIAGLHLFQLERIYNLTGLVGRLVGRITGFERRLKQLEDNVHAQNLVSGNSGEPSRYY